MVDMTGTVHYRAEKHLHELFNPLTINKCTIKDSFHDVPRSKNIPKELFNQGYRLAQSDALSLFTSVLLQKTINIMLKKVYVEKVVNTSIKKNNMGKLIKDTCKNTAFVFDNETYKQIDGVSMGSPLAPVLTKIIMIELESTIRKKLFDTRQKKFTVVTMMILC